MHKGETASCHRTGFSFVTPDTFDTFHNTDKKIAERKEMLQGLWPTNSCGYCQKIEVAGGFSDRMLHLDIPNQSPSELESDPTAVEVTPTIVEVYFNNTCNLSCVYCNPDLSSKLNQEYKKFGDFSHNGVELKSVQVTPMYDNMLKKFWEWMKQHSTKLKRLHVLGGEPFYQTEFDQCMEYFKNSYHPDLELTVVTNLMISKDKLEARIGEFKKLLAEQRLKRIDITCSIDCWGSEQEYVRHGINLEQWQNNFELLLQQAWLTVNINQTISVLTIKTMPTLIEKINHWKKQRSIGHYFSEVSPAPTYLVPSILGPNVFDKDFEIILSCMLDNTDQDRIAKKYMAGIANKIKNSIVDHTEIIKLKTFLNENDYRRKTTWPLVFPWLAKEIEHVV